MGVGWLYVSLWCDVLHFYSYRLPAVLHTHTCAGWWAEDECESMSWHWCRSWPHQRIRLCPLDRDSYSGSHHLILTGLTIILVFSRLALWPRMSSLWKEGGPLTFVLVCCQRLYFLRHLCLFTLERTANIACLLSVNTWYKHLVGVFSLALGEMSLLQCWTLSTKDSATHSDCLSNAAVF